MLKEAIELQKKAVNKLIEVSKEKEEITFRAPTGSGKTYMMADFMDQTIEEDSNAIFLVSTLSKGNLAGQNYEKFVMYHEKSTFKNIRPYLISSEVSGEEDLFIPTDFNVYILPRDLYKRGGRLMQGAMENFLEEMTRMKWLGGKERKIYLIKDECHVLTSNLDHLSQDYFYRTINFSATPKLSRRQVPDVEITDEEAVLAKLIKHIEIKEEGSLQEALDTFESIKEKYRNLLGVNPCLIIQISNQEKADEELKNTIFPALKSKHQELKWMLIVDKEEKCDTNDFFKVKKMPVSKWKDYVKENHSTIDIIIFKMVISEGFDIPRACMLFQQRDSQSKQLDEQVIGRVRRNPRLLDFETLSEEAKKLAMTAWVWGIIPKEKKIARKVKLFDEPQDFIESIKIKTTELQDIKEKIDFCSATYLENKERHFQYQSIFEMYKKLNKSDYEIKEMCYAYATNYQMWWEFNENIENIITENKKYFCDYEKSMVLKKDDLEKTIEVSFPKESMYIDNGNYLNIGNWVWKRWDGLDKFSFDSEAEREWASILKDLSGAYIKSIVTGKVNPQKGMKNIFGETEPDRLETYTKVLWGKNYILNSEIKFAYYLNGKHFSYPDFVFIDKKNRVHLFEVKSVNFSENMQPDFDKEAYKRKIEELKKSYKVASKLTNQIFYLPVLKGDIWHITQLKEGEEYHLTKDQFFHFFEK